MRAVLQRVKSARVEVDGNVVGSIGHGLLVFVGIGADDSKKDIDYIVNKTINLRIFGDEKSKFNLSLLDIGGEVLLVSQFTLFGDCRKGRRPSFSGAAPINVAKETYQEVIEAFREKGIKVETGEFQAMMEVYLVNDGPVTMLLDSKKLF
ncbi:MAG TPA: D-tyrosyl-tRNA(Tyr) deacylase [Deltaproteobacteria bacterium]|nr:D-tyrosyl-tRNA(Tyr) deacylase [Deltaproteobacteria bacterium]